MASYDNYEDNGEYVDKDSSAYVLDRRAYRHRRRIRNQLIVAIVTVILLIGILTGAIIGIRKLGAFLNSVTQVPVTEQSTDQEENAEEQVTIEAPGN